MNKKRPARLRQIELVPNRPVERWKAAAKWLLASLILFYLFKSVAEQWKVVQHYEWEIDFLRAFVATIVAIGNFLLIVWIWNRLLLHVGARVAYWTSYRIWFISALLRYIPGKVLGIVGMLYLCQKEGISKSECLTSGAMNQAFSLFSGLSLGLIYFLVYPSEIVHYSAVLLALGAVLIGFMLMPVFIRRIINPFLKRRASSPIIWDMNVRRSIFFVGMYVIVWVSYGVGFFLIVQALTDISVSYFPNMAGIFAISYLAGFLAMITPGGLGVREGLLTVLLSNYLPVPVAIIVSAIARIWLTIAELICIAVAYKCR